MISLTAATSLLDRPTRSNYFMLQVSVAFLCTFASVHPGNCRKLFCESYRDDYVCSFVVMQFVGIQENNLDFNPNICCLNLASATVVACSMTPSIAILFNRPVDNGAAGAAMAAPLFSQIKICDPLKLNFD